MTITGKWHGCHFKKPSEKELADDKLLYGSIKLDFDSFLSSLHWIISLSFCSFSYKGLCFVKLKLSVSDVIVSQKGSNGDRKLHFFGRDYDFNCTLCTKLHLWAKIQSNGDYSQIHLYANAILKPDWS